MIRIAVLALPLLALAACGSPEVRVPTPEPAPIARQAIRYPSVEVREVSLPAYAALEEIFVQAPDGTLSPAGEQLWADDPTRAVTLDLTRALTRITGARVASEPWPFDAYPAARVDVRVSDLIADPAGGVRMTGQAFIAPLDGRGRDKALLFDLTAPASLPQTPAAIAAARSALISDLALLIATDGLR